MKRILLVLALVSIPNQVLSTQADDQVCFADKYGVRRHSPDAWPSWTKSMPNHKGDKCWYPAVSRHDKRWKSTSHQRVHKEIKEINADISHEVKRRGIAHTPDGTYYKIGDEIYIVPKNEVRNSFKERFEAAYSTKYVLGIGF
jgi:hypothetical protein